MKDYIEAIDNGIIIIMIKRLSFAKAMDAEITRSLHTRERLNRERVDHVAALLEKAYLKIYLKRGEK
jgi:hypothetical protein